MKSIRQRRSKKAERTGGTVGVIVKGGAKENSTKSRRKRRCRNSKGVGEEWIMRASGPAAGHHQKQKFHEGQKEHERQKEYKGQKEHE